jgi:hypothetical protein
VAQDPRLVAFKLLRFAAVPFQQLDLLPPNLPDPKGRIITAAVDMQGRPRRFEYRNTPFAFAGFRSAGDFLPNTDQRRFLVGRLAKLKEVGLGQLTEDDIVEQLTDNWIPIWVIFDLKDQYIGVEVNNQFGNLFHVARVLESGLNPEISTQYRQEIVISPVTDARRFWDVVNRYDRVYRIRLHFVSPNILGTPESARDALDAWKEIFNQTDTVIDLTNREGELKPSERVLSDAVEYIAQGEGDWKVTVGDSETSTKVSFSSRDEVEGFESDVQRASALSEPSRATPEVAQSLVNRMMAVIRKRDAA